MAGGRHSLICNVNRSLTFPTTQMEVNWLDSHNNSIDPNNFLFAIIGEAATDLNYLSSTLIFQHVRTSLAGPYTCVVHIVGPGAATNYTVSRTLNFQVKSEYYMWLNLAISNSVNKLL